MVNYTVKRYFFEQSAVREFYSGAYYDLFLVMRGSGVFRCSEVVLPAQQQNLIIFKPGQGGRLEYAGAYGPLELIRVQLSPQTLAQLSDADTDLEKSFNVVPFRQVAVRPDSQIYMLLKNLARKLLMLPQERTQFGAAVFEHGILQMFVVLALRACIHAEFHTASVSRHHLMLDEVFLFIQAHLTEELTLPSGNQYTHALTEILLCKLTCAVKCYTVDKICSLVISILTSAASSVHCKSVSGDCHRTLSL